MTFINWISLAVVVVILASGIIVKLKTRKKVNDMDGFCGIAENGRKKGKHPVKK